MTSKPSQNRTTLRESSRTLHLEMLESRNMLSGTGLVGQYFHNADFTGLAAERIEAVDFNWGLTSPIAGIDPDTFSVRWTGQVEAQHSEEYTFRTTSDQGVRLWIDGQLIIDNWVPHFATVDTGTITLNANQRYDLRLEYYENTGSALINLTWSSLSQVLELIPAEHLYASPNGLNGKYTDTLGGSVTRTDSSIDFDWGVGQSHPSIAADQFDVLWTGFIRADFSEKYDFSVLSDEGVRLWIGNELVVDDWQPHSTQTAAGSKKMEAGKWYDLRMEYFDNTGNAQVALSWSSNNQTGPGINEIIPTSNLRAAKEAREEFTNPLGWGQDPYVTLWNDSYLYVESSGGSVRIHQAEALEDIHPNNPNSTSVVAWTPPGGTNYSEQIWAPEIHSINGKWYIYVAASDGNNATHRMHVLERNDSDPMGPYVYKGEINTGGPGVGDWAIDGTVLSWQGNNYFIWSGWPDPVNPLNPEGTQNLYIAQMSNPWTLTGPQSLLSSVTESWEDADGPGPSSLAINEGPQILIHEGKLHIIYSANSYTMQEYLLGRLTYDGVGPIQNAASWQKSSGPVFQQAGDIVGTGHASFTTSQDGSENWIVYHAHHDKNIFQDDRDILIQPFEFNPDGTPDFGTPIPTSTSLPVPLGAADPERPFIAGDYDANGIVDTADLEVWQLSFGQVVFPGISADGNGNGKIDAADYTLWRDSLSASNNPVDPTVAYWRHEEGFAGASIPAGPDTVLDSSGNGNLMQTFDPTFTSATYSTSVSPLALRSGLSNNLSLDFGPGGDDPNLNDDNFSVGKPINSQLFESMTVELSFNLNNVNGFQALLGKDGKPTASPVSPLKIVIRGDDFPNTINNQLFVEWLDGDGDAHFLAGGETITAGSWYHVAFTLTDTTAELWVAGETGDYLLVDSLSGQDFTGLNNEVLFDSVGSYTVGRGAYDGDITDWSDSLIDEVRIANSRLAPSEFLFVPNYSLASSAIESDSSDVQITTLATVPVDASAILAEIPGHSANPNTRLSLSPLGSTKLNLPSLPLRDEVFALIARMDTNGISIESDAEAEEDRTLPKLGNDLVSELKLFFNWPSP